MPHLEVHYQVTEQADWQELRKPYMAIQSYYKPVYAFKEKILSNLQKIRSVNTVGILFLSLLTSNHAPKLVFTVSDN